MASCAMNVELQSTGLHGVRIGLTVAVLRGRRQRLDIGRDRSNVVIRQVTGTVQNHSVHRAHYPSSTAGARFQVIANVLLRPCAQSTAGGREIDRRALDAAAILVLVVILASAIGHPLALL